MRNEDWTYIGIDRITARDPHRVRFALSLEPVASRVYGGFPHLGKGRASWRGVRTNAGYSALLRLLWTSFADDTRCARIPGRLRGSSPPVSHVAPIDPAVLPQLHDLLTGRSARVLRTLRTTALTDRVPSYMHGVLADDLVAAEEFYVIGPRRLRRLRLRHGVASGTIDARMFASLVAAETEAEVGTIATASADA